MASLIRTDSTGQVWARCLGCNGWVAIIGPDEADAAPDGGALHDPVEACQWFFDTDVLVMAQALNRRLSARNN